MMVLSLLLGIRLRISNNLQLVPNQINNIFKTLSKPKKIMMLNQTRTTICQNMKISCVRLLVLKSRTSIPSQKFVLKPQKDRKGKLGLPKLNLCSGK
jgi:hypothetical protein